MDFRILGPLEVAGETGPVGLTGGKQKATLAILLLNAGRVVPRDRLVDDLWGDDVPETAQKMVQIFVSQLRKQLPAGLLRTRAPGYLIELDGRSLDLLRFEELDTQGRRALEQGRPAEAAKRLREALSLWRGPALGEFEEPFAGHESSRLEELQLACLEERIEADLALERHAELVGELDMLVRRHPHRERLRGQLMLSLYRSGRHAEALESYQAFRRMLDDELGIEPSAQLKMLERRMLQQDASLQLKAQARTTGRSVAPVVASSDAAPLPGRERELRHLQRLLGEALEGERRLVFVTGDAGIGKTAIVESLLAGMADTGRLAIARGQCVEHRGVGEPYLPFLDALGRLCRQEGGERLVVLLGRHAPMWLAQMPGLVTDAELEAIQRRIVGATPERMLREMLEALEAIATELPLVVVLEDLHWSDPSTVDLLEALARRPDPAHLFVLGTYRRAEAAARRHPVHELEQGLRARALCAEVAVGALSEEAVAEYLAVRLESGMDGLARLLHERTGGNPLFVKTLLDSWLERGLLESDAEALELEPLAADIPETVLELIGQTVRQLDASDRELLEVASVAGRQFSVLTVAAGSGRAEEDVEERCEALARDARLIQRLDEAIWPDGTVSARYVFSHDLYQEALYRKLPPSRRRRLHREIGTRLQDVHGGRAREVAAELADHFVRGNDTERAVAMLRLAAEQALARSGHREAIEHLSVALGLLEQLPAGSERAERELVLQITLGNALITAQGYAAPETRATYARARALAAELGDDPAHVLPVLYGLWNNELVAGRHASAYELAATFLDLAERHGDDAVFVAHRAVAWPLFALGRFRDAQAHLEEIVARYDPGLHTELIRVYGEDPGIAGSSALGLCSWYLGLVDRAATTSELAVKRARELDHPLSLAYALLFDATLGQLSCDHSVTSERAGAARAVAGAYGIATFEGWASVIHGWAIARGGDADEGLSTMQAGLDATAANESTITRPYLLGLIADALACEGRVHEGLRAIDEAVALVETNDERYFEAELHRLRGDLLLRKAEPSPAAAEEAFRRALEVARSQESKSLELRAAMSAARLLASQERANEGRALVSKVYGSFTEGFTTRDLVEARRLIEENGSLTP